MQRTLNAADRELYGECAAAALRGESSANWPTVGDGPAGVDGLRNKLIGIQAAGAAAPVTVSELVADLIATALTSTSSVQASALGLAVQSGLGRSGSPGGLVTLVAGDRATEVWARDDGATVNAPGGATATLDHTATAMLATVTALGAAAAYVGFADALAASILVRLREAKAASNDRWAGQALRHEIANAVMSRDVGLLHGLRALEEPLDSKTATTFSLLALIESGQGVQATIAMARQLSGQRGDLAGIRRAAEITESVATLGDLAGNGTRLRQWIYGVAVQHA